jgi:hypothetical protein
VYTASRDPLREKEDSFPEIFIQEMLARTTESGLIWRWDHPRLGLMRFSDLSHTHGTDRDDFELSISLICAWWQWKNRTYDEGIASQNKNSVILNNDVNEKQLNSDDQGSEKSLSVPGDNKKHFKYLEELLRCKRALRINIAIIYAIGHSIL